MPIKTTTGHLLTSPLASFLADIQTHSRVLQYVYHGGHSPGPLLQKEPAWTGIVEEMTLTMGFQREKQIVKERQRERECETE